MLELGTYLCLVPWPDITMPLPRFFHARFHNLAISSSKSPHYFGTFTSHIAAFCRCFRFVLLKFTSPHVSPRFSSARNERIRSNHLVLPLNRKSIAKNTPAQIAYLLREKRGPLVFGENARFVRKWQLSERTTKSKTQAPRLLVFS